MPESSDPARPSADAILARVSRGDRDHEGHLKIFLGMAPGVGKTYTMLEAARARAMAGDHVVVGVAETHGRIETAEQLLGMDIVPRRTVEHRGTRLEEMDVDAILERRPQLAIVDELAHTNAPGSRHPKRCQDVYELLAAGIDVYTTVNIQHLESLNDAVAQITGVRVRETLPDTMLERADEVELVDLPVEELIERLGEGKVYFPEQAQRATQQYFREGNLNALRQLALRYVAGRVDRDMHTYMRAHAIPGPWPTNERLMVSVSPSPLSPRLVRATRRMAERRASEWYAVYVETPAQNRLAEADRARVADTLRLAESLGGHAVTLPGSDIAEELLRFAQVQNITEIVVGRSMRSWWIELVRGSIVPRLVRNTFGIDVYVVTAEDDGGPTERAAAVTPEAPRHIALGQYAWATLAVAVAAGLAGILRSELGVANLSMVFLVAVLFVAIRWGLRASIAASLISVLVYDFLYVPPFHTFTIDSPQDVLALTVFLIVAILTSNLTGRIRDQSEAARRREARTSALYNLSRRIAGSFDVAAIANVIVAEVATYLDARVSLLVRDDERLVERAATAGVGLSESEMAAATWSLRHERLAGSGTDTLPGEKWLYVPLRSAGRTVGVMALCVESAARLLDPDQRRMVEAFADLAAVALERARLAGEIEQAAMITERERLQSLLLSSISHDLRTPLASIVGAASSLVEGVDRYDRETRQDLALTIREEGERLDRFVGNLLDATRLEAGALRLTRDWVEPGDLVSSALRSLGQRLGRHEVVLDLPPTLPMINVDFVLVEQVLVNILDNAVKYSPDDSKVRVEGWHDDESQFIAITDEGPGIPPEDLERVFDRFYRVQHSDKRSAGTGLGLSICRGIMSEHGGTITAQSPVENGRGTRIVLRFPSAVASPSPVGAEERS